MKHPTPGADCTRGVRRGCTAPPGRAAEPAPLPAPAPAWLCVAAGPCFAIPAAAAALCSSSYRCRRCAHRTSCRAAATAEVPPLEPAAMASGAGHTHTHTRISAHSLLQPLEACLTATLMPSVPVALHTTPKPPDPSLSLFVYPRRKPRLFACRAPGRKTRTKQRYRASRGKDTAPCVCVCVCVCV